QSSPVVGADGTIYIGADVGKVYAVSPDGIQQWAFSTDESDRVESTPAIGADGTIYVGSQDKKLYAINPNGSKKWSFATGGSIESSPVIGNDGTVYIGSADKKIYAVKGTSGGPDTTAPWSMFHGNPQHTGLAD
ncbi:MAG: PQQ-like beta-propeller repeat protein, partial [bacterium]|nr:PQQ-like beta-propeller repeat protein [bacterium]